MRCRDVKNYVFPHFKKFRIRNKVMKDPKRIKCIGLLNAVLLNMETCEKIEEIIHDAFKTDVVKYNRKMRSLLFNFKNDSNFRESVLQRKHDLKVLPHITPSEINSRLWDPIFEKIEKKRLINEQIDKLCA